MRRVSTNINGAANEVRRPPPAEVNTVTLAKRHTHLSANPFAIPAPIAWRGLRARVGFSRWLPHD